VMSADWKIDVLKEQVLTSVRRIDEYRGILHSRRHLAASPVFKGIPNFRETRIAMLRAETVDELFAILERAREAGRRENHLAPTGKSISAERKIVWLRLENHSAEIDSCPWAIVVILCISVCLIVYNRKVSFSLSMTSSVESSSMKSNMSYRA
jgi:hypothetical protein